MKLRKRTRSRKFHLLPKRTGVFLFWLYWSWVVKK